jgi:hypothetical protein
MTTCPTCGAAVLPPRVFCKLSCRIAHERRQARTPQLFPHELTLETELPSAEDVAHARRRREEIGKLYRGKR